MARWHLNIWPKDFVRDSLVKAMWSQSLIEELSNHHVRTIDNDIDVASCETKIFQILTQCSVKVRPGISVQKMAILGSAPRNFLWKIDQKRQVRPLSGILFNYKFCKGNSKSASPRTFEKISENVIIHLYVL